MSELHKFLFDGLPVRGIIVRLTDSWTEILRRRASNNQTGAYAAPVAELLGEMVAASALMLGERPDATLLAATAMIVAGIALGTGGGSGSRRVAR